MWRWRRSSLAGLVFQLDSADQFGGTWPSRRLSILESNAIQREAVPREQDSIGFQPDYRSGSLSAGRFLVYNEVARMVFLDERHFLSESAPIERILRT